MSLGIQGLADGSWDAVGLCPRCFTIVVRMADVVITSGTIEFMCTRQACRQRSILGGPDPEKPARPLVVVVTSVEMYREYHMQAERRGAAGHSFPMGRGPAPAD